MKTQPLELKEEEIDKTEKTMGFWKRQFQKEVTLPQTIFDLFFGLFLPIFCFFYDPVVFKGGNGLIGYGSPLLAQTKPFAYLLTYIALSSLVIWLTCGEKLKRFNALLAGVFFASGLVSMIIGIILLPFSLLALLFLVGALGFTPLFTAFVYLRNGVRSFNQSAQYFEQSLLVKGVTVVAILCLAIPAIFSIKLNRAIDDMVTYANSRDIYSSTFRVSLIWYLVDTDKIVNAYISEQSEEKKKALQTAFELIDGGNIEIAAKRKYFD